MHSSEEPNNADVFALVIQKTLGIDTMPSLDDTRVVEPLRPVDLNAPSASTDVGDVSWTVPTIGFTTATFVPGVVPHTWQATASAGMSIGQQGMVVASKALALTAIDLFATPSLVQAARTDFDRQLTGKPTVPSSPSGKGHRSITAIIEIGLRWDMTNP